jgi:hypothetical protein
MTIPYKILGVSDDITTCDNCGKTNLKRTVALEKDGHVVHFGTDCAGRACGKRQDIVKANAEGVAFAQRLLKLQKTKGYKDKQLELAYWDRFGSNELRRDRGYWSLGDYGRLKL